MSVYDVVIVGSGPAGYTAAIYTGRAGLKPVVLAGEVDSGGALMQTTEVENFPGFPTGIMGPDLMAKFQEQAERFGADIRFEDVTKLRLDGEIKELITDEGTYRAKTVILAMGSAYRHLGVKGEEEFSGRGVSYCATCDGFFFKDQEIAVVGGGDSAMEEAIFLSRFASKVTVVHRREELRASEIMAKRAKDNPKIEFAWNSVVESINGTDQVSGMTLRSTVSDETRELPVQGVFVAIGHDPRSQVLAGQVELDEGGFVKVSEPSTNTNLAGVFACGDLVDRNYQQAITAAASGCRAAIDAQHFLAN